MTLHRLSEDAAGVFIIAATPFTETGALDLESADRLVDFYLGHGVSGMTILGIMGEAPKLTATESETFLTRVLNRIDGRIPVVVGVSTAGLDNLARLSEVAMGAGAAGVMVAPQSGTRTEEQLDAYFGAVCEALGPEIPVVYQDYPQTTAVPISVGAFLHLVRQYRQIVMLKHEDCPGLGKLSAIRARSQDVGVRRVSILCGNGGLYLPQEMARGADGAMTGFAYPEMLVQVVAKARAGDLDGAEDLFDAYLPLVRYEQQPGMGLAIRKEILRRRGAIASAAVRAPGPKLTERDQAELSRMLARLDRALDGLA